MFNPRTDRLPPSGTPTTYAVRNRPYRAGPAWDSDDPFVRWQYLVDQGLIGTTAPLAPENIDNIVRTEIALGLRTPREDGA